MFSNAKKRQALFMILTGVFLLGFFALYTVTAFADQQQVVYEDRTNGIKLTGTVAETAGGGQTVTITACESDRSSYEVQIPDSIEGIPVCAISRDVFKGNTGITAVSLPDGVTNLPLGAFNGCRNMTSIDLNQVTDIGDYISGWQTLNGTLALSTITVAEDNPALAVRDGVLFSKDMTKLMVYPSALEGSSYVMPNSVIQLWNRAFNCVADLEEVTLSERIAEYGDSFFDCPILRKLNLNMITNVYSDNFLWCPTLESVTVSDNNEQFTIKDGELFSKDMKRILFYPPVQPGDSYTIPDGVTEIGAGAFLNSNLRVVRMPDSLKRVHAWGFAYSKRLQEIIFPEGLETIETNACTGCSSLAAVYVPDSVTLIDAGSLDGPMTKPYAVLYGNTEDANGAKTLIYQYAAACPNDYTFIDIKEQKMPCSIELNVPDEIRMDADAPVRRLDVFSAAELSYESSSPGIVAVDNEGVLTARASGKAVVTIRTADAVHETVTKTVSVTVTGFPQPVKQAKQTIKGASSFSKYYGCSPFPINQTAKTAITCKSSNPAVATVTKDGRVKILRPGKVKIQVKAAASARWFGASKTVTITVRVKTPGFTAKRKGKKVKLSWTKVTKARGYQIYIKYPGSKKFVRALTESYKVKSVTHRGLKKGKTYRYKVRAFVKVGGKRYYSAFSPVKTIRIK